MHKERTKLFHDQYIRRKEFFTGRNVLLYHSNFTFPGKLRSHWTSPFIVSHVFPHGAIEIQDPTRGAHFKMNEQRLKPFLELPIEEREVECLMLYEPKYRD